MSEKRGRSHLFVILVLLIGTGVAAVAPYLKIDSTVTSFQNRQVPGKEVPVEPRRLAAVEDMNFQNVLFFGWAVAIVGAGGALIVMEKRVRHVPWRHWSFLLAPPALLLAFHSIRAGVFYRRVLTYQRLKQNFDSLDNMNHLLLLQEVFLYWAMGVIALFLLTFVIGIVHRDADPSHGPEES